MRSLGVISSAGAVLYHEVTANYVGLKIRQYNTHTHTQAPYSRPIQQDRMDNVIVLMAGHQT